MVFMSFSLALSSQTNLFLLFPFMFLGKKTVWGVFMAHGKNKYSPVVFLLNRAINIKVPLDYIYLIWFQRACITNPVFKNFW